MEKSLSKKGQFGARDKLGYTLGDFGCNMSFQLISSYAMIFFTQGMGLTLKTWGIIVFIAKVFDAINDPIIGALVDKSKPKKQGKFRPWIWWGSFFILLTTFLFFIDIRSFSYGAKFAYCLIIYCLWSLAYTATNVPYGSLNACLTDDIKERATLSSLRNVGAGIAGLPIMIFMPMLIYGEQDPITGIKPIFAERFVYIALVMGIFAWLGLMALYFLTRERTVHVPRAEKYEMKKALASFFKNRPALGISLASFAQIALFMTMTITMPLVFQVYFKNTDMIIVGSMVMYLPLVLCIPFVGICTKKYGKKEMCVYPMILAIVLCFIMMFVNFPQNTAGGWIYVIFMGLSNGCTGFFTLATWSFVADAVDYQELQTKRREEGSVYSIYSFVRKLGQATCQSLVAFLLAKIGLDTQNIQTTTDETALGTLKVSVVLPFLGIMLMFIALFFIYDLNKNKTIKLSNDLKERRENQAEDQSQELF